jgi:hypothetical protein
MPMQNFAASAGALGVPIAVELFAQEDATVDAYPSPLIYTAADPNTIPADAVELGYEVADSEFWSGLSNMGFEFICWFCIDAVIL